MRNALEEAVYVVLGGPTKMCLALQCSNSNIQELVKKGLVQVRNTALAIEQATERAGCRVPAAELMDLVPWQGPERHPGLRASAEEVAMAEVAARRTAVKDAARPTVSARKGSRGKVVKKWPTSPSSRWLTLLAGRAGHRRCRPESSPPRRLSSFSLGLAVAR